MFGALMGQAPQFSTALWPSQKQRPFEPQPGAAPPPPKPAPTMQRPVNGGAPASAAPPKPAMGAMARGRLDKQKAAAGRRTKPLPATPSHPLLASAGQRLASLQRPGQGVFRAPAAMGGTMGRLPFPQPSEGAPAGPPQGGPMGFAPKPMNPAGAWQGGTEGAGPGGNIAPPPIPGSENGAATDWQAKWKSMLPFLMQGGFGGWGG